jgi:hypothetical protein
MPRMKVAALVAACALAVPARAATHFTTAWKSPDVSHITLGKGQKVLVMVRTRPARTSRRPGANTPSSCG